MTQANNQHDKEECSDKFDSGKDNNIILYIFELVEQSDEDDIMAVYESWVHHYTPESKQ